MPSGLNIAALSKRTGVAPDTLRKWEQRYRILRPLRTPGGQRRYDERDVERVQWLRERLSEGYRIGEAASLLGAVEPAPGRSPDDHRDGILAALERRDAAEVGQRLDQAFALAGLDEMLTGVLVPVLRVVGDRWESGDLTVAEEHLLTEAVRARLGHLLADAGGGVRGIAVLTCAPGERHELGLMMAAIALRRDGWQVVYLGSDAPIGDAVALAQRLHADVLGISVALEERIPDLETSLRDAELPSGLELLVGGAAATPDVARRLGARRADPDLARAVAELRALRTG